MGSKHGTPRDEALPVNPLMRQIYNSRETRYAGQVDCTGVLPKPEMTQVATTRVSLDSCIDKQSCWFRLVKPRVYCFQFKFTSVSGCIIEVRYFATEDASGKITSESQPVVLQFPPGKDQVFPPGQVLLDLNSFTDSQIELLGKTYPLGILIYPVNLIQQYQITYLTLYENQSGLQVGSCKLKTGVNNHMFETLELFGLNELKSDCIICMVESKNTALLPCNHLCVCSDCAVLLMATGNKRCPVCRSGES